MNLGSVIDYCITYNNTMQPEEEYDEEPGRRKATQADWDAFFGG